MMPQRRASHQCSEQLWLWIERKRGVVPLVLAASGRAGQSLFSSYGGCTWLFAVDAATPQATRQPFLRA